MVLRGEAAAPAIDLAPLAREVIAVVTPMATKAKTVREKRIRLYIIVKQTLLAFMNGAMPQVAIEHGRKAISAYERPTINEVEAATISGGARAAESKKAA